MINVGYNLFFSISVLKINLKNWERQAFVKVRLSYSTIRIGDGHLVSSCLEQKYVNSDEITFG